MHKFFLAIFALFYACFNFLAEANEATAPKPLTHYKQYLYDSHERIEAIENYNISENGSQQLFYTERFNWHPEHSEKLTSRLLEDSKGKTLISQSFSYDKDGRLSEEVHWKTEDETLYLHHCYQYDEIKNQCLRKSVVSRSCDKYPSHRLEAPDLEILSEEYTLKNSDELKENIFESLENGIEIGCYGEKERCIDNVRITFINGIMNFKEDLLNSVRFLSETHGNVPIHYVFKPTEGWTWDLLRSSLAKLGFVSSHSYALADLWKSLIAEMGGTEGEGTIIHYAHSIGGTKTLVAKFLLTPEEQRMIQIITLGSPSIIPNEDFRSVINYASVHDWITLLDPINRIMSYFKNYEHVVCAGDPDNAPISDHFFTDHFLEGETYKSLIKFHGQEFIKLHIIN